MSATIRRLAMLALGVALAACSSTVVREPPAPARQPSRATLPKAGATAVVQRGDTLFGIAFRNGVSVGDLAAWNSLAPPYTIYPGQRLRLSPRSRTASATPRPGPPRTSATRPVAVKPAGPSSGRPAASPARPARPTPAPVTAPPVDSGIAWRWPADGGLLRRFVSGEPTRQGIDIGGASGAPVRAAADGTVVYSGAGLVGYGELVIVKHSEAWLSAYGHNRRRLVNEGELVKAGQQIAEMGRSGAPRDMLHFEIRYNGRPVDPLQYLPAR